MNIEMINFGEMLSNYPSGTEDFLKAKAFLLKDIKENESICFDFKSIKILSVGWAEAFFDGIQTTYDNKVEFKNVDDNPVVRDVLSFLSQDSRFPIFESLK